MQENAAATESALTDRLRFVKLDGKSAEQMKQLQSIIERELPIGLDKFYDQIRVTEEVRKLFRGEDDIANAKKAQINHWQAISSGTFDSRYCANANAIGKSHSRIGLEPRWYIGGYSPIVEHLVSDYQGSLAEGLASTREGGGKQVRGGARLSHQGRADRHGFRILRLPR